MDYKLAFELLSKLIDLSVNPSVADERKRAALIAAYQFKELILNDNVGLFAFQQTMREVRYSPDDFLEVVFTKE